MNRIKLILILIIALSLSYSNTSDEKAVVDFADITTEEQNINSSESEAVYVAIDYADINLVRLPESIDFITGASPGMSLCNFFSCYCSPG